MDQVGEAVAWRDRLANLVHLDRSIGRFVCRAARLAFLYGYLGRRPQRAEARKIVGELMSIRAGIERRWHRRHARGGARQPRPAQMSSAAQAGE